MIVEKLVSVSLLHITYTFQYVGLGRQKISSRFLESQSSYIEAKSRRGKVRRLLGQIGLSYNVGTKHTVSLCIVRHVKNSFSLLLCSILIVR